MTKFWQLPFAIGMKCLLIFIYLGGSFQAEARPGGGEHYSGGNSSGGRSSGSSYSEHSSSASSSRSNGSSYEGGGRHIEDVHFAEFVPIFTGFGIIIAAFLVIGFILFFVDRRKKTHPKSIHRTTVRVNPSVKPQGFVRLQEHDPGFSVETFVEKTKFVVARVNEAWIHNTMEQVRRLISDGVYVRFQTQINLLKSQGLRNWMADWQVVSAEVLAAESDPLWDTIHMKVTGEARDLDVSIQLSSLEAEEMTHRQAPLRRYQEVWSFLRRSGSLSKAGTALLEGHCPNCAAEMPLADVVKCEHCQALVNSGEYDFVLAEITQPEEWSPGSSNQAIAGLSDLQKRDPTVSRQELEDRASVLFWKWIEALRCDNVEKLARFCIGSLLDAETQRNLSLQPRTAMREVAVGSADLHWVMMNAQEQRDQAQVEIRWSASFHEGETENMHTSLLMARSNQVVSKRGFSCLDCPVCKGPLAGSDMIKCSYCGENISGGKYEWALEKVSLRAC